MDYFICLECAILTTSCRRTQRFVTMPVPSRDVLTEISRDGAQRQLHQAGGSPSFATTRQLEGTTPFSKSWRVENRDFESRHNPRHSCCNRDFGWFRGGLWWRNGSILQRPRYRYSEPNPCTSPSARPPDFGVVQAGKRPVSQQASGPQANRVACDRARGGSKYRDNVFRMKTPIVRGFSNMIRWLCILPHLVIEAVAAKRNARIRFLRGLKSKSFAASWVVIASSPAPTTVAGYWRLVQNSITTSPASSALSRRRPILAGWSSSGKAERAKRLGGRRSGAVCSKWSRAERAKMPAGDLSSVRRPSM